MTSISELDSDDSLIGAVRELFGPRVRATTGSTSERNLKTPICEVAGQPVSPSSIHTRARFLVRDGRR